MRNLLIFGFQVPDGLRCAIRSFFRVALFDVGACSVNFAAVSWVAMSFHAFELVVLVVPMVITVFPFLSLVVLRLLSCSLIISIYSSSSYSPVSWCSPPVAFAVVFVYSMPHL